MAATRKKEKEEAGKYYLGKISTLKPSWDELEAAHGRDVKQKYTLTRESIRKYEKLIDRIINSKRRQETIIREDWEIRRDHQYRQDVQQLII